MKVPHVTITWRDWQPQFGLRGLLLMIALVSVILAAGRYWIISGPLAWKFFAPTDVRTASQGNVVLVNFEADWDLGSKANKRFLFGDPEIRRLIRERGIVCYNADWSNGNDEIKQELQSLQCNSVPVIALYPPGNSGPTVVLRDAISKQQLINAINTVAPTPIASNAMNSLWYGGLGILTLIGISWFLARTEKQQNAL